MKRPHIHSPVDDLESGFWVTFWSLLFHEDHEGLCSQLEQWARRMFTNNKRQEAAEGNIILGGPKSSIMQRFSSVFEASLDGSVRDKILSWRDVVMRAPENAGEEYFLPHFHRAALQGVVDLLEVMLEHWNGEIGWESWTGPS